jgi:hypothetical protein
VRERAQRANDKRKIQPETLFMHILKAVIPFTLALNIAQAGVVTMGANQQKGDYTQYCKSVNEQLDNVRSQQRYNSTQWHRDEYKRLSDLRNQHCMRS